jgi:hypothetical protein
MIRREIDGKTLYGIEFQMTEKIDQKEIHLVTRCIRERHLDLSGVTYLKDSVFIEFETERIDEEETTLRDELLTLLESLINVTTDKPEILADGTDTATITATVDDTTSTETIELYNGDTLVDSTPAVDGVATFEITMTETGTLTLTVKSTTKYGQADVSIEGV